MSAVGFWIVVLNSDNLSVSLVLPDGNNQYRCLGTGPALAWNPEDESIIGAVDQSLSALAENFKLPESDEPSQTAFILPSYWIGADGKILSSVLKKIELLCHQLHFSPMGFISHDEALVENQNLIEGIPVSFVLVHFEKQSFDVSLVYLGEVKERLHRRFSDLFRPAFLETALLELKTESTLPPSLIVFGQIDNDLITGLKDYPWIGKKDVEAFLHLPSIKPCSFTEVIDIYIRVILNQLHLLPSTPTLPPATLTNEVPPQDLGFTSDQNFETPPPPPLSDFSPPPSVPVRKLFLPKIPRTIFRFRLPRFPSFHFSPFILLGFLPIFVFIYIFFYRVHLSLFINPYEFSEKIPITLSVSAPSIDFSQHLIPAKALTFTVRASSSQATSGRVTVGDKARGEVVVYNLQNKIQNLPQSTILVDSSGKKFELLTSVNVSPSNANLDQGIITLGQAKVAVVAAEIGEEYNLPKDTRLNIKDYPDTLLIAKVSQPLAGGNKRQVNAVAPTDKINLEQKMSALITEQIDAKISQAIKENPAIIKESAQIKKDRADFSREVNEQADELTATANASISLFSLTLPRPKILEAFLSSKITSSQYEPIFDSSVLEFTFDKISSDQASGYLNLKVSALPKLDLVKIQRSLAGKTVSQSTAILRKEVDRLYNFKIKQAFVLLPLRPQNINIEVSR